MHMLLMSLIMLAISSQVTISSGERINRQVGSIAISMTIGRSLTVAKTVLLLILTWDITA